jgi:hypothetical protein
MLSTCIFAIVLTSFLVNGFVNHRCRSPLVLELQATTDAPEGTVTVSPLFRILDSVIPEPVMHGKHANLFASLQNRSRNNATLVHGLEETRRRTNADFRFRRVKARASRKPRVQAKFPRLFVRVEAALRRISRQAYSVINGSLAGDIGFDPLGIITFFNIS